MGEKKIHNYYKVLIFKQKYVVIFQRYTTTKKWGNYTQTIVQDISISYYFLTLGFK
jgi:hypothetical protein